MTTIIDEIDEAIGWVEYEYGFVADVLKKSKEKIRCMQTLLRNANVYISAETPDTDDRIDRQEDLVKRIEAELR